MLNGFSRRLPVPSTLLFFLPIFSLVTAVYLTQLDRPAMAQCSKEALFSASSGTGRSAFINKTLVVHCDQKIKSHKLIKFTGTAGKGLCQDAYTVSNDIHLKIRFNASTYGRPAEGKCSWSVATTYGANDIFHLQLDSTPFELTEQGMEDSTSAENEDKQ